MDDARFAEIFARLEALDVRERELRSFGDAAPGEDDPRLPAENLREAAARRAFADTLADLGAAPEDVVAARDERGELLRELVAGLPGDTWLRHPLDERTAVMVHDADGAGPDLFYAPWRLASQAPPGSRPEAVYRAGEELWSGLTSRAWRPSKTALWAVVATTTPALLFGGEGPAPVADAPAGEEVPAQLLASLLWELPPLAGSVLWLVACAQLFLLAHFLLYRFFEPGGEILAQERALAAYRTGPPHEANGPVPAERTG